MSKVWTEHTMMRTDTDLMELAFATVIVSTMKFKDNAGLARSAVNDLAGAHEILNNEVDGMMLAYDRIVEDVVASAKGAGFWEGLSTDGACLRAWVMAGDKV